MNHPTQRLIDAGNQLLIEVAANNSIDTTLWRMFNDGGVEAEVGEFLYSLVRMVKPDFVLETGTHLGIGASYMGMGIQDNGKGHLVTLEFQPQHIAVAKERFIKLGLQGIVQVDCIKSQQYVPTQPIDILLLDTEPDQRFGELIQFYPHVNPGGVIFIHDLHREFCQGNVNPDHPEIPSWPFGDLPQKIKNWIEWGELRPWVFETPRGIVGFYKKHERDYV